MTTRTTTTTVTFARPFRLRGFDEVLPAGDYAVETDEERLEGVFSVAYRRVQTLLHLPGRSGRRGGSRTLVIDRGALDEALARDQAPG